MADDKKAPKTMEEIQKGMWGGIVGSGPGFGFPTSGPGDHLRQPVPEADKEK